MRCTRFEYATVDDKGTKEGTVDIAQLGDFKLLAYEIDLVRIIGRELVDLENGTDPAEAAATILKAASNLLDRLDPAGMVSARITHHNGYLTDRYQQKKTPAERQLDEGHNGIHTNELHEDPNGAAMLENG